MVTRNNGSKSAATCNKFCGDGELPELKLRNTKDVMYVIILIENGVKATAAVINSLYQNNWHLSISTVYRENCYFHA